MELYTLQIIWFFLIGLLITGYLILDGFDLGAGIITLFTKSSDDRRIIINSIGPFWDGNEVWLLTAGGALFAAFPIVYATVFSGFYLAMILLLFALIFRAVSIEFRGKIESVKWIRFWDSAFGIGSLVAAFLVGVAMGNILKGIPLNDEFIFTGSFIGLLNPHSLLVGALTVALLTMHGAWFLTLKTSGELKSAMHGHAKTFLFFTGFFFVLTLISTVVTSPFLFDGVFTNPIFWLGVVLLIGSLTCQVMNVVKGRDLRGFVSSSILILSVNLLVGACMFPRLVPSSLDIGNSLTITNASSTAPTLTTMLVITLIGMPIVLGYTAYIYWIFRGKTVINDTSY